MFFVYSEKYFPDIGPHVFPIQKYRLVKARLDAQGVGLACYGEPADPDDDLLALVHTPAYLDDLRACRITQRTMFSELPVARDIIDASKLAAAGTCLAMEQAVKSGGSVHIGGGFHHAFAAKAEGFCYINDLAIAARLFKAKKHGANVLIIDLDLHQGNGTAHIFRGDDSIFTFSMHQSDIYPVKEQSDYDIHLNAGTADEEYLEQLHLALADIRRRFKPDMLLYQAGADPYYEDQLGQLALTKAGLRQRDELVLRFGLELGVPIVVTLGGGYAINTDDTVDIHYNTCKLFYDHMQRCDLPG